VEAPKVSLLFVQICVEVVKSHINKCIPHKIFQVQHVTVHQLSNMQCVDNDKYEAYPESKDTSHVGQ